MIQVYSKALKKEISIERLLGKVEGERKGPTVVFFAGIHGNETSGVFALKEVFNSIKEKEIKGNLYAISGNLKALEQNKRFIDEDLNRIWTNYNVHALDIKKNKNTEQQEQTEIFNIVKQIITKHSGPFYFIDFHTTSSKTLPFITINDALINRKFSKQFPVPIVLGIEEYLNGPLLSYINELGYVSLGFESGQHDEKSSIENHKAFAYLAMVFARVLDKVELPKANEYYDQLKVACNNKSDISEVIYLHKIKPDESFKMKNGFKSFQKVEKGTILATSNGKEIKSHKNAMLFMPLYQESGDDGFFIIKKIRPFFLKLSVVLRKFKADNLLAILPGISWDDKRKNVLKVNLKTTKFLAKPIFHLLGYRNRTMDQTHLKLYNRERIAKVDMYKNESWFN